MTHSIFDERLLPQQKYENNKQLDDMLDKFNEVVSTMNSPVRGGYLVNISEKTMHL
jgi:hypothetical protein